MFLVGNALEVICVETKLLSAAYLDIFVSSMQLHILYDFHHFLTLTKALVYSLPFWNKFVMHNSMNVRGEKKNHLRMLFTSEQT